MSADPADREPGAGCVRRWFAAFGFNLVLLAGAAFPVGLAATWAVAVLSGIEPRGVSEMMVLLFRIFVLPILVLGAVYISLLMALAWCIPEWGRRIAIAGSILVVVWGVLIPEDAPSRIIPFWCGWTACMAVFAAWMHVDREAPRWQAWLAAGLPAPLLTAAAMGVIQRSGGG